MLVLSEDEKHLVKEALMHAAEMWIDLARKKLKLDGKPMKSTAGLVDYYFKKADKLSEISIRIK